MSKYFVKVYTDEFNEKEWKDLKPEEIHFISFKGKKFDEERKVIYGLMNRLCLMTQIFLNGVEIVV